MLPTATGIKKHKNCLLGGGTLQIQTRIGFLIL